jgi:hypothetical protein
VRLVNLVISSITVSEKFTGNGLRFTGLQEVGGTTLRNCCFNTGQMFMQKMTSKQLFILQLRVSHFLQPMAASALGGIEWPHRLGEHFAVKPG